MITVGAVYVVARNYGDMYEASALSRRERAPVPSHT